MSPQTLYRQHAAAAVARRARAASASPMTNPPVITAAIVNGLAHPDFLVEMDAIAVVPG